MTHDPTAPALPFGAHPGSDPAAMGAPRARSEPSTAAPRDGDRFDCALDHMQAGRWPAAFAALAALADEGHPQSARLAMIFVRRGTSLFGGTFVATPAQRRLWEAAG